MKLASLRGIAAASATLLTLSLAPTAPAQESPVLPYRAGDRSITALNILPPGQGKYMNSADLATAQGGGPQYPHNFDQIDMYDQMVQAAPGVKKGNLGDLFKDASFGVPPDDIASQISPKEGVEILRDASFGVPHVYGETRADTMFGVGYVSAQDRFFMMDVLRHLGRGRLSELLGASEANLQQDRAQRMVADYREDEFTAMLDRAASLHPVLGPLAKQDIENYTAGVNKWIDDAIANDELPGEYAALQLEPADWIPEDSVAVASVIGASLGVGGGQELENAAFLAALEEEGYTPAEARQIYDDLRFEEDPEAPVKIKRRFPYVSDLPAADPSTVAIPDDPQGVLSQTRATQPPPFIDGPFGKIRLRFPEGASNALLVGAEMSASGRPIAVFGPQTGYWSPEILMEVDMHGPGLHGRGAAFPGVSLYVLLGRGEDYGWSATSAGADQVDTWAVELCDGDDEGTAVTVDDNYYLRDGSCVPMQDTGISYVAKPSAGGLPPFPPEPTDPTDPVLVEIPTWRTDKGIVQARGTVDGTPVAFVRQRASYGGEVDSALTYVEMMDPDRIDGAEDFQRAFYRFNFTFNWFYVDDRDIAYQLGGRHPVRAAGTDPDLPIWDVAANDWQGFLSFEDTPKAKSPRQGFITSWNNKQAPGFAAADNEWSYGPVHRSQPLDDRIMDYAPGGVSLVELVNAMGDAATVDLRGDKVLPVMLDVVGSPGSPKLASAVALLRDWHDSGAHRRSSVKDGAYDHAAAVALMDAWWDRALDAAFGPVLGDALDDVPAGRDNEPGPTGSAYLNGWYGQLEKDLRQTLGGPVAKPFAFRYCGFGDLAACRGALRDSLEAAVDELIADFGADPAGWDADEEGDRIRFAALGIQGQESMQWQNRPTFQQVLEFGDLCPGAEHRRGIHHVGSGAPEILRGTRYDDVLCGRGGPDVLFGLGGDDRLLGGKGADTMRGGAGDDFLAGGKGPDDLRGGAGDDTLRGNKGHDSLVGGGGDDGCFGGPGQDTFRGCEQRRA